MYTLYLSLGTRYSKTHLLLFGCPLKHEFILFPFFSYSSSAVDTAEVLKYRWDGTARWHFFVLSGRTEILGLRLSYVSAK